MLRVPQRGPSRHQHMTDPFDFNSLSEAYRAAKSATSPELRSTYTTMFVVWSIAHIAYYIMAGTTVIVLGRRLIQASFAGFKEARRDRT